ncbi:MAG: T9SS C-terminal target domain-containing protein [Bacteroidetes bacterium]|nr:MAG: T9SS C-terminal target domain-containing protein [Bacteroidota bacterium]
MKNLILLLTIYTSITFNLNAQCGINSNCDIPYTTFSMLENGLFQSAKSLHIMGNKNTLLIGIGAATAQQPDGQFKQMERYVVVTFNGNNYIKTNTFHDFELVSDNSIYKSKDFSVLKAEGRNASNEINLILYTISGNNIVPFLKYDGYPTSPPGINTTGLGAYYRSDNAWVYRTATEDEKKYFNNSYSGKIMVRITADGYKLYTPKHPDDIATYTGTYFTSGDKNTLCYSNGVDKVFILKWNGSEYVKYGNPIMLSGKILSLSYDGKFISIINNGRVILKDNGAKYEMYGNSLPSSNDEFGIFNKSLYFEITESRVCPNNNVLSGSYATIYQDNGAGFVDTKLRLTLRGNGSKFNNGFFINESNKLVFSKETYLQNYENNTITSFFCTTTSGSRIDEVMYIWDIGGKLGLPTASAEQISSKVEFSISPNPNNSSFIVQSAVFPVEYSITNIFGVVIKTGILNAKETQMELNLASGMYFFRADKQNVKMMVE